MVSVWITDDEVVSIGDSVVTLLTPQNVTNGLSLTVPGGNSYGNLVIIVGDHINRMDETVECQTDDLPTQANTYIDIGEYFRTVRHRRFAHFTTGVLSSRGSRILSRGKFTRLLGDCHDHYAIRHNHHRR